MGAYNDEKLCAIKKMSDGAGRKETDIDKMNDYNGEIDAASSK